MSLWRDFVSGATSGVDFVKRVSQLLFNQGFWIRLGTAVAGIALVVIGIIIMLRRQISGSISEAAKVATVV